MFYAIDAVNTKKNIAQRFLCKNWTDGGDVGQLFVGFGGSPIAGLGLSLQLTAYPCRSRWLDP